MLVFFVWWTPFVSWDELQQYTVSAALYIYTVNRIYCYTSIYLYLSILVYTPYSFACVGSDFPCKPFHFSDLFNTFFYKIFNISDIIALWLLCRSDIFSFFYTMFSHHFFLVCILWGVAFVVLSLDICYLTSFIDIIGRSVYNLILLRKD